MPTKQKYNYPKDFLTKKGSLKKSHLKKAAAFRKSLKKPKKTRKKLSASQKQKIAQGVSRYHKNCKYSMGVVKNISKTKKDLKDAIK
jgi:hypothetical protein